MDLPLIFTTVWILFSETIAFLAFGRGCRACLAALLGSIILAGGLIYILLWQFARGSGSPNWKERSDSELQEQHVEPTLRRKVVDCSPLSRIEIERLLSTRSNATYCLLANNRSLLMQDLERMYELGDSEVRYILGTNLVRQPLASQFRWRYRNECAKRRNACVVLIVVWFVVLLGAKFYKRHIAGSSKSAESFGPSLR